MADDPASPVRVVCVGSLNLDVVVGVDHLPGPDETLLAHSIAEFNGGKGANQIVAAARLGAQAAMVGCVGFDGRGQSLLDGLDMAGVDRRWVRRVDVLSGTALITVADDGEVTIVVASGANRSVSPDVVAAAADVIARSDVLLLQGEVPAMAAKAAAETARGAGVRVVCNPAPFNEVAAAVLPLADVVVVNRHERALMGSLDRGVLVTTLGSEGCTVQMGGTSTTAVAVPPVAARVVDPTGAGDAFVAALAVRLAEGAHPLEAAAFANAAGAVAVEVAGAQPSLPSRAAVVARLEP